MALHSANALKNKVCGILKSRCENTSGYVSRWEENLLPGLSPVWCKNDLGQGAGNELKTKFRALHSSAALAVNTFALFKNHPGAAKVLDQVGFNSLCFEKKVDNGLVGTKPNLDVWLEADNGVVAIESKFLEYFTPTTPKFVDTYSLSRLSQMSAAEPWWCVLEKSRSAPAQFLDRAQLVKHAVGMFKYLQSNPDKKATLLYLFWEPANAAEYEFFSLHRRQLGTLASEVQGSKLQFQAMSYPELWSQWLQNPATKDHAVALMERYFFSL